MTEEFPLSTVEPPELPGLGKGPLPESKAESFEFIISQFRPYIKYHFDTSHSLDASLRASEKQLISQK